ncbi:MAG: PSD1 domain-containing protein [Candidatus Saccharimonas sp.]|nr:PSD1 domain-containing protein [Planctomycetaceae bacterium]
MLHRPFTLGVLLAACAVSGATLTAAPPPTAEGLEFFEKRIRPVLVEHCYECHSAGKKAKGGLALDTRDAVLKGGDSGAVLVAGDPGKSRLIDAVRYKNRDLQMPPKGALSDSQVRDLEAWVKMGAPDPREAKPVGGTGQRVIAIDEGRKFWSFAPVSNPALPVVTRGDWVKSPVDAFVLAGLEKTGLTPAPPADKRTLIRRATFDLTGLPPTTDEVDAFVVDESADAFGRVVERLLSSPQYGERWGRHWLDVARYADTNGLDENIAYGHSWRYRDYVVNAFNTDKPYDQFLVEQLAGDLLPAASEAQRIENLTATGFLAIGARVLAEPDVRKLEMDIIDEQLDTLGKAFLGMTFGCCRCHDHKFDPVPTADYYALAAIFRSTRSLSEEKMGNVKFGYEHSLATPEQLEAKQKHEAAVTSQREKVTKFTGEQRTKLKDDLHGHAAEYLAASAELSADADFARINQLAEQRGLRARYLLTCRLYLALNPEHPVFTRWRELSAARQPDAVRMHYLKLFADVAVALKEAKAKDEKATKPADEQLAAAHDALNEKAGFLTIPDKDADAFDADVLATVERMKSELKGVEDQTPEPPALMGVKDGTITNTLPIHIRGSYLSLGTEIERGFPEVMRTSLAPHILPAKQSGRLQLARWMAGSEHPLTARVMVNRIWRWHFGSGLVRTTENFGLLGDKPSHPALLDWLARRFVEQGWSVKEMHRLILLSSTYQMASVNHPAGQSPDPALADPDNRLLWRANVQRLEAEQICDALFAVSGSLNEQLGGKTIPLRNRHYVFDHTSIDATRYESTRRALYLPLIRNHLYDLLEQFDYPDPTVPTGSRNSTVVAPQALILLNAPVVREAAERLARKLLAGTGDDRVLVEQAYVALYARPPTEQEATRAIGFVKGRSDRHEAWTLLCHTLLAANEFLYLR